MGVSPYIYSLLSLVLSRFICEPSAKGPSGKASGGLEAMLIQSPWGVPQWVPADAVRRQVRDDYGLLDAFFILEWVCGSIYYRISLTSKK
jgi:hypothetical protein